MQLSLAWANDFYKVQIEYEIPQLDIVAIQAANWAFTLKNALNRILNCKRIRLKQVEIITAIKNNNIQIALTITKEKAELDRLYRNLYN